jgi:hypothetical protein
MPFLNGIAGTVSGNTANGTTYSLLVQNSVCGSTGVSVNNAPQVYYAFQTPTYGTGILYLDTCQATWYACESIITGTLR